jgi:protein ImuA
VERVEGHGREQELILPFRASAIDDVCRMELCNAVICLKRSGGRCQPICGLATLFVAGIFACTGPVLWCLRGRDPFAPALPRVALHPDRLIFCETWKDRDVLPAREGGLNVEASRAWSAKSRGRR